MEPSREAKIEVVTLTKDEIADMMRQAALTGAQAAADAVIQNTKKNEKDKKDRRLHNTELLLKNYRILKEHAANAVYEKLPDDSEKEDILQSIMSEKNDKVIIESIMKTAERTSIMLDHIDKMIEVYRIFCSKGSDREKRQYKVIKGFYISKEKQNIENLSKKFRVSRMTIYDDLKVGKNRLSTLFFGIDGLMIF